MRRNRGCGMDVSMTFRMDGMEVYGRQLQVGGVGVETCVDVGTRVDGGGEGT